jgi:molecular chaperone HtpG
MSKKGDTIHQFEYKAEMKQLLNLIIHSLYTHPEVFLRELISNASDALNKVRVLKLTDKNVIDPEAELKITIKADEKKKTFSIEDSGIGMTEEDLINNIGTIARSGTLEYLQTHKNDQKALEEELIGKFGVGFYSVFMVTDEVIIETRHASENAKGYRWRSSGEGTFTIEEIVKKERGTKIAFTLKETAKEFAEEFKIKSIINKYSNFADFPIYLGDEKINTVSALWRKNASDVTESDLNEFYKYISNDYEEPLGHLQLNLEGASVNFKALLFIPKNAPFDLYRNPHFYKGLNLYSNKILIQNECKDLMPEYLGFIKGVVDTIDLPLNVSREVTQSSPVMAKIKKAIVKRVFALLSDWAEKDSEKYLTFYKNFGRLLETGINSDFENRDKIMELLRYESSTKKSGELVSLKEYVGRMKDDQKEIYYISGDSRDALESNPNLEYFKKNDIEVFFLTDPIDVFIFPSLSEYDKKKIKSIDKADIELKPEDKIEKPEDNLSQSLLDLFKETLGERVENVVASKRLVDSPVTLVAGKDAMDPQIERMMKMMNQGHMGMGAKKIMEVNTDHPLIRNLSKKYLANSTDPFIKTCIEQLYAGSLLIEGDIKSPSDFVKRMNQIIEEATK